MIIDYDHNPALTTDQKLQSLKESVQMALNELEANNAPEQKNSLAKTIIEGYAGSTLDGSAQSVKSAIDTIGADVSGMLDSVYPVGSIYISTNAASPADLFGGTWVQIKGRFLLGTGTPDANTTTYWGTDITNFEGDSLNSPVREMGGESKHTLDVNQIPSHRHAAVFVQEGSGDYLTFQGAVRTGDSVPWAYGSNTGGGQAHNNMPPYFAVYMWERTA